MLIRTGDSYVAEYGLISFRVGKKLVVGDMKNPGLESVIYTAQENERLWRFEASEKYVCWFADIENSDGVLHQYQLRCYNRATGELSTVDAADLRDTETMGPMTFTGTYDNKVYWVKTDYEQAITSIMQYNLDTNELAVIASEGLLDNESCDCEIIHFMDVKDQYLFYATRGLADEQATELIVLDLAAGGAELLRVKLPEIDRGRNNTDGERLFPVYIYGLSYDPPTQAFALYYRSGERDGVAYYRVGDEKVTEFFTPSSQDYLCADKIALDAESKAIYYTVYSMISGMVADHYEGIRFNYETYTVKRLPRCFWMMSDGYMCFGAGDDGINEVVWTIFDN